MKHANHVGIHQKGGFHRKVSKVTATHFQQLQRRLIRKRCLKSKQKVKLISRLLQIRNRLKHFGTNWISSFSLPTNYPHFLHVWFFFSIFQLIYWLSIALYAIKRRCEISNHFERHQSKLARLVSSNTCSAL